MFYGESENTDMVNGTKPKAGSSYAYQYMSTSILVDGRRFIVAVIPIKSREHLLSYIEYALEQIKSMCMPAKYLLLGEGFSSISLPVYLQEHRYRYILHFTPRVTKKLNPKDEESSIYPCEHNRPFKLVRADDSKPITNIFATNMNFNRILKRFEQKWRMETSYRKQNEFLARKHSKKYVVPILYHSVAVCIYNC